MLSLFLMPTIEPLKPGFASPYSREAFAGVTESGATVGALPTVGDSDDVFYDEAAQRLYISGGEGAIAVYRQVDADHYEEIARITTVKGARTSFFSPALGRLFLAVRREGQNPAALWVYEVAH